jgi:uncharacterized alpha-E superfamily protein
MRIFVPSPYELSARERVARGARLIARCASMAAAGAGAWIVILALGSAAGIWGQEAAATIARAF